MSKKFAMRGVFLAYDHGLEHGPTDFTDVNVSPSYIIDIAEKAEVDALILLKGAARHYYEKKVGIPLILKLNGKTALYGGEPFSTQNTSVDEAVKLGASAVGYTVYFGSKYEKYMIREFGRIEEQAHSIGLPVVMWSYPRGTSIKDDEAPEIVAYAARAAFELGADIVKLKYPNDDSKLNWVVKSADKTKVFLAGGKKLDDKNIEEHVKKAIDAGFSGIAVGRNIWQSDDPVERIRKLKETIRY
ncbi:MAG: aldolase [Candidatus Parvarchaeota archaeon]|jgi:class I fructose-bisphosphate aldolase|nr:aldolase [Candidatus Parvarchaeota archaeon]